MNNAGRRRVLRAVAGLSALGAALRCLPAAAREWPYAGSTAEELLQLADRARGGEAAGVVWDVTAISRGAGASEADPATKLRVYAANDSSLAETLAPAKSAGARMLQVGRNMWLYKPGLRKPVSISPRQRLSGMAAVGDIASTHYAREYKVESAAQELLGDEPVKVLDLTAAQRTSTYDRIRYWVSLRSGLGLRAEFFSVGGKRLKVAEFEYANVVEIAGRKQAFVSRMLITDALTDAQTELRYDRVRIQPVPSSLFDVNGLT